MSEIRKRADGRYEFVVEAGRDPRTGKRRQVRRIRSTRREARDELDRIRAQASAGTYVTRKDRNVPMGEYLTDWLASIRGTRQPSTWHSYRRYLETHVIPRIGGLPIGDVTGATLSQLYSELADDGARRDGKPGGLSPRTVAYIATILSAAFGDAVDDGLLATNPAQRARRRRNDDASKPEIRTWDAATVANFLERLNGDRYREPFAFLVTTGMRRGEALGLRWSDLDLEAGRASIRQTVTAIAHKVHVAPRTKTGKGRAVDLDAGTVAELRAHRAGQAREMLALGLRPGPGTLVFCHPEGRPYHPERFSREFDRRVARLGIEPRIRLHDLRHTWATLALQAGVQIKVVSERLGHSKISTTADLYQHVTPTMGAEAAERVAALVRGAGGRSTDGAWPEPSVADDRPIGEASEAAPPLASRT